MYLKCLKKQWHGEGNNQSLIKRTPRVSLWMDGWVVY